MCESERERESVEICPYFQRFLCFPGLSWSVDEKSLKDAFSSFGDVTEGTSTLQSYYVIHLFDELSQ